MGAPERTRQISRVEFGGEVEGARHQDGHHMWHFVSRCWHWHRHGGGAARLQRDCPCRLPVVRGHLHGTIFGVAFLQGRTGCRYPTIDADTQYHGEVLIDDITKMD